MKNELETFSDILTEFQLMKTLLTGAPGEPGLLQRVEAAGPVIERLTQLLDQLRAVSETDAQTVANLATRLDGFEQRVGQVVAGTFSDAFLAEQGQRLVVAVGQQLAQEAAKSALDKAVSAIAGEIADSAQKIPDRVLAEHHVKSVTELRGENLSLKSQLAAALDKNRERIYGAMQNMLMAFVAGALAAGIGMSYGSKFM